MDPTPADPAQVASTPSEIAALSALREVTGETLGPMERHSYRVFQLSRQMAADRSLEVDEEVLFIAALLHDIGLYEGASRGGVYVTDGAKFAAELLADTDWPADRKTLCLNAIERHHEVRPQWSAGPEVELVRRADLIELSGTAIKFGLDRSWLKDLNSTVPRKGLYGEVGKMVVKALRERPSTVPRILLRGR